MVKYLKFCDATLHFGKAILRENFVLTGILEICLTFTLTTIEEGDKNFCNMLMEMSKNYLLNYQVYWV